MQMIRDISERKLRFQKYFINNERSGRYLFECTRFKSQRIKKGEDVGIDYEADLLRTVKLFLYRLFSECINHNHQHMSYVFTNLEIYIYRNNVGPGR